jgi:2-polyprenyl-3-methyl-5-hydroxy-6-metoxy-1,4-benzoquinol methylase
MPPLPDPTAALDAVETLVRSAPVVITHQEIGLVDDEAAYLAFNRKRFRETMSRVAAAVPAGARVLDVGGQFLHVAVALREMGYAVDAVDLAPYAEEPRLLARASGRLRVHRIGPLGRLDFPDATFDTVLVLEVLEHLTQNPRPLWLEVARVLKPRGRLVVTTPNLYRVGGGGGAVLQMLRLVTGRGMTPTVDQVLTFQTGAHHWKEYGRRELYRYFSLLGWHIVRLDSFNYLPTRRWWLVALKRVFPALHDCLYLELLKS